MNKTLQVYALCEYGCPKAVFLRRCNANALLDSMPAGFTVRAVPVVDSDGLMLQRITDAYEGAESAEEVEGDGADA